MTQQTDDAQAREALKRGFDLLNAGRYAESEAVFSTLLDSPSVAATAAYGSGVAHFALKNDPDAKALLSKAVRLNPANANAVYYLARIAERSGDVNEAQAQYRRALRINPQHRAARAKLQQAPSGTASPGPEAGRAPPSGPASPAPGAGVAPAAPAQQYAPSTQNPQQADQPGPAPGQPNVPQAGNGQVYAGAGRTSLRDIGRDVLPTAIPLAVLVLASVVAGKIVQSVADKIPQSAVPPAIGLTGAERGAAIVFIGAVVGLVLLIWRPQSPAGRITLLALVAETLLIVTSGLGGKLGDGGIAQSAVWAAGIVLLVYVIWNALAARSGAARSGGIPASAAPGPAVQRNSYVGIVRNFRISQAQVRQVVAAYGQGMQVKQVWSFMLELQDESGRTNGQQKPVQMTGSHIKGILNEGHQVAISRREKESRGMLEPRRIKNLSTGGEVYTSMF
jgi:Tetratricopeptide repeat